MSNRVAGGDLILEFVMKQRGVSIEAAEVVEVSTKFRVRGCFRVKIRVTNGNRLPLASYTVHTAVQLVQVWSFVTATDAALQGPIVIGIPNQVSSRADVTAKRLVLVITSTQRQRQIIAKTPFVFQKNSFGGLLEVLPGQAVSHVSIPPLGTYGRDMRLTYRHDQLGVKYQACGFQLPSISPHDIRIPSVGISDRARNCSTFSLSGVMHETAVPRAKVDTAGMGQGRLVALETQFVCVTIASADSFSVTIPVQAIQGAQLTFVFVVDLATT